MNRPPIPAVPAVRAALLGVVLALLPLGAVTPAAAATPTHTPAPTATATPVPTQTPLPTDTPYPSPTATRRPTLTLSATAGTTTTAIVAAGSDFPPHTAVTLYWDGATHALGSADTDDSGHVRLDVTIPADAATGGHAIRAVGANQTGAVALFTVVAGQGYQGGGSAPHYCLGGLVQWCPDLGGLAGAAFGAIGGALGGLVVALFSPIEHMFSDQFTALVRPFQDTLTKTPNIPAQDSWAGFRSFQTALQVLAGTLFFGFIVVGMFARYLEQLGVGDFATLTSPLRRAVVVTGLLMGYPTLMGFGFTALNTAADTINAIPLAAHESAWEAVRGAIFAVQNALSFQGVLDVIVMMIAFVFVILSVVVRDFGLGVLGGLYIVGPLCLATFVSPYFDVIATWWVKTFIALALWPIGYAVGLKLIALMFAGGGPMSEMGGFSAALGALGLVLMLYKMPALVGSTVGASGAIIGAVASSAADAGLGTAMNAARRYTLGRFFPGAGQG